MCVITLMSPTRGQECVQDEEMMKVVVDLNVEELVKVRK